MASSHSPMSNHSHNGNDDDGEVMEIVNIDDYNAEEGKMQASVSWLISKVYGSNVPDQLTYLFSKDKERTILKPLVVQCLVSGELYCSAASTIFHDSALINQSHGTVLQALHRYQIDVIDSDSGSSVTETILRQDAPFKLNAHIAMIDGLMTAHMREVISVERVVEALKKYTNVHRNEQPVDVEDAILFWINKICATVRDNLGHGKQNNQEAPLIPEMDDLYEDICDGTCAATVIHFYQPNSLPFHEICFNDPMSMPDCAHNLRLLERFCQRHLPWNIFHFSLEDILYMHESLQPNVNAFFADLFSFLELHQDAKSSGQKAQTKQRRSLPEKVEIPNLRSGSTSSGRVVLNKPTKAMQPPMNLRGGTTGNSLATSRLNSTDSLATDRSVDSLRYRPYVGSSTESPLTAPGSHGSPSSGVTRNFALPIGFQNPDQAAAGGQYQRSDSLPARQGGPTAAIRLQLEQKRRQYEQQRMEQGSKLAEERQKRSQEAFFALKGKSNQQIGPGSSSAAESNSPAASLLRKKATTPTGESPSMSVAGGGRMGGGSNLSQLAELSKSIHEMRQEMKRLSMEQEKLHKIVEPAPVVVSLGIGTGSPPTMTYAASPNYTQFHVTQQQSPNIGHQFQAPITSHYASGQFQMPSQSFNVSTSPGIHQQYSQPQQQQHAFTLAPSMNQNGASPSLSQMHMARSSMDGGMSGPSFKLHSEGEFQSRLDPSLELTKTMSNWGMTYRVPQKPQRKTWGEQSFAGNGHQNFQQQQGDFERQQQQVMYSPSTQHPPGGMMTGFAMAAENERHQQQQQQFLMMQQQQQQLQHLHQQQQQLLEQAALMQGDFRANEASTFDGMSTVEIVPSEPEFTSQHISAQASAMTMSGDIRTIRTSTDAVSAHSMTAAALSPTGFYGEGGSGSSKSSTPAPVDNSGAAGMSREASPGVGFVVGDPDRDRRKEIELEKKRELIMSSALRRREMMEQRRAQIDAESAKKREEKQMQEELEEQKKRERELHRQKVMQDYQRRKAEQDAMDPSSASTSAAISSTPQSTKTLPRTQQQRNHSQPPQRPKSQVFGGKISGASPGIVPSGSVDNLDQLDSKSQSSDGTGGSGNAAAAVVPAEPTLKLFVKPSQKTNRNLVLNAIQYCVLAGAVNEGVKQKVLTELAKSDSKHFLLLFRDKKCQFKALYSWDQVSDNAHKLYGLGPTTCSEKYMDLMFKYDSGAKQFTMIPTKHLSAQIDGFTVKDEYWQKKKPLYSTKP